MHIGDREHYGSRIDNVLMRLTDIVYGMPFLPFIIVLISFGLTLAVPAASARAEGWLSRLTGRVRVGTANGFWSGFLVGSGLGLIYAPCAGPILAGVITVSAAQSFTAARLAVALASAVLARFTSMAKRCDPARLR